jgi:hypothetical protein
MPLFRTLLAAALFMLTVACNSPSPVPAEAGIDGCYGISDRPLFTLADGQIRRATDGVGMATYSRESDEIVTTLRFTPGLAFSRRDDEMLMGQSAEANLYLPISVVGDRLRLLIPFDPDFGVAEAFRISTSGC